MITCWNPQACLFDVCTEPTKDDNVCENAKAYADKCADAGSPVVGGSK